MRLLAASLIAGGCLLGAASASAEPLKLDDVVLDTVTAGNDHPAIANRRLALIGFASLLAAQTIADDYKAKTGEDVNTSPTVFPIVAGIQGFGVSQLQGAGPQAIALWFR